MTTLVGLGRGHLLLFFFFFFFLVTVIFKCFSMFYLENEGISFHHTCTLKENTYQIIKVSEN